MIKVTEPPLHMLVSLKSKDISEMPPKIKLPETLSTLSLMLKDLSEENLMMLSSKKIWNYGLSKLSLELTTNPCFKLNTRENINNSIPKKSLPWFSLKWEKLLKLILDKKSHMLLSLSPLISMILKDKLPKMPELLLDLTYSVLSMNLPLLLLLMV